MNSQNEKPIASLSLDLDNKWSYMKTHGDAGWESFPSYLDTVVPRSLEFLRDRGLTITYFIVGQDAALEKNHEALAMIPAAGHEVGNHSFNHEPWLHLYSKEELVEEFEKAEASIMQATGEKPIGFRGPGFSLSPTVLEVLSEREYKYDCSTFPTFIGPLARAYYFLQSSNMSDEQKEQRKLLFGKLSDGFQPLKPFKWRLSEKSLVELPVTTLPVFKFPIHASYIIYLSTYSRHLALIYWRIALKMSLRLGIQPSILLHPLDFLGPDDAPELAFFPGMALGLDTKLSIVDSMLTALQRGFEVVNMNEHARFVSNADMTLTEKELPLGNNVHYEKGA
jgi:hypothetical protein